jgi:hypothetical protein
VQLILWQRESRVWQLNWSQGQLNLFAFSGSGAGDGNRTNPISQNKGVTARFAVQLESNEVKTRGLRLFIPERIKNEVDSKPAPFAKERKGCGTQIRFCA